MPARPVLRVVRGQAVAAAAAALLPRQRRVSLRQAGEQLGSSHRRQAAVDAVDMQPQAAVLRAIPAISRSGSTAPVLVVPAVPAIAIAGIPARRSRSIAA